MVPEVTCGNPTSIQAENPPANRAIESQNNLVIFQKGTPVTPMAVHSKRANQSYSPHVKWTVTPIAWKRISNNPVAPNGIDVATIAQRKALRRVQRNIRRNVLPNVIHAADHVTGEIRLAVGEIK